MGLEYYVVIVPKREKRRLYGKFRQNRGDILKELCGQERNALLEGQLVPDHIHKCLSVPPKVSIAFIIGFLKGKRAIRIHREILKVKRVTGLHFWSRSYCVCTVGFDEETTRKYISEQEEAEKQQQDLEFE